MRALLCRKCNMGLGLFSDSPATLKRAAAYIIRHQDFNHDAWIRAEYARHPRATCDA